MIKKQSVHHDYLSFEMLLHYIKLLYDRKVPVKNGFVDC